LKAIISDEDAKACVESLLSNNPNRYFTTSFERSLSEPLTNTSWLIFKNSILSDPDWKALAAAISPAWEKVAENFEHRETETFARIIRDKDARTEEILQDLAENLEASNPNWEARLQDALSSQKRTIIRR